MLRIFKKSPRNESSHGSEDVADKTCGEGYDAWTYNKETGGVETFITAYPYIPGSGFAYALLWVDPDRISKLTAWKQAYENGDHSPSPTVMYALLRFSPGVNFDGSKLLIQAGPPEGYQATFMHSFEYEQMDDGSTRIGTNDIREVGKIAKLFESGEAFVLKIFQGEGETIGELTEMLVYEFPERKGFSDCFRTMGSRAPYIDNERAA